MSRKTSFENLKNLRDQLISRESKLAIDNKTMLSLLSCVKLVHKDLSKDKPDIQSAIDRLDELLATASIKKYSGAQ